MTYLYKNWSDIYKEALDFEGSDDCERLHNNRKLYYVTVVDDDGVTPYCFLQINNTFLLVGFIDGHKRQYMNYVFSEYEKGKIFLKEIHYWDFDGSTDEKIFSTFYSMSREGGLKIIKTDLKTRESEVLTAKNPVDVSENYDFYPEFGKYENIIRFERGAYKKSVIGR